MNSRTVAVPGPRPSPPGRRRVGRGRTTTVVYDSAHLRVRLNNDHVLWFVRDVAGALGFRPPLTSGSDVPQVLVTTAGLDAVMAAAGFCAPRAFTTWAAGIERQLPRQR
ncbi:hypothetical protein [Streptomyces sp. WM6378]|uniref:hypothetical protein n=1 Tax=Streptomyces sp. WM6378 TaxID=1415557 RepID=UPI0006AFDC3C|nr:hypothetical protein [Streptomyces sp. WM6378]KOU50123.1 hypothetical protein ADK54_10250 [Streptomyces sp. WM6378]